MATPTPTPTAAQIVAFAEIALIAADDVLSVISAGNDQDIIDAKWAATLTDITAWASVGTDAGDIKKIDTIEFFEGAAANARLDMRNRLRARYGLLPVTEDGIVLGGMDITSLKWFGSRC